MKKMIIGAAVCMTALAALRRFGPAIHERAMNKCHQMMSKCGECSRSKPVPRSARPA